MEHETHQQKLLEAFAKLLNVEEAEAAARTELAKAEAHANGLVTRAKLQMGDAWREIEALMKETGEFEVLLPGSVTDFRIGYSPTRESVKVDDPHAVPDRFSKLERKPMLKEIGEHLKSLPVSQRPNWARLDRSEPELGWKAVKKTAKS